MARRNITQIEVVKAIQKGIISAQSDYKRSAEDWLTNAPEYLSTVMAFKSILRKLKALDKLTNITSGYITLECSTDYIGKIIKRGPRTQNSLTERSRVDLFLWASSGAPKAVIEIKRDFRNPKGIEDIERIRQFLLYCTDPKPVFGVFATIAYKDIEIDKTIQETKDSVWDEIEIFKILVENNAHGLSCRPHYLEPQPLQVIDDNGKSHTRLWCPLCFTFRRTRIQR